ncbi:GntR family transcriptional regulator [Compostimonas suwonensis]|uniref:DNA-binding GntR family transcriptional regulator n=1 Tax=Compostimonas suwonensis TaxID=1048394 RepID=A0A2M9C491_9MICO|nr:GntR family transcriptional regulator [Compostimonas suwonensis]PJJ65351.1 DNA-binding GntR family transcriptional regulator [Compostimonas suwonensis]
MAELKSRAIYEALRSEILTGNREPGQRLVLRQIAQEYGASDIPVREALRMLEQDGLVEITPYQGARVTTLSPEQVSEAYFVRGHLEALATELAATRLTGDDFARLDQLVEAMAEGEPDPIDYAELNRQFHTYIVEHCGNQVLQDAIVSIWQTQSAFQIVFRLDPDRRQDSNHEHREIMRALRDGDRRKAHDLALDHKFATATALSEALQAHHDGVSEIA